MRRPFRAAESKIAVCANLHGTNGAFIAVFAGFRGKQHIGIEIPAVPQAAHRIRRQIVLRNEQRSGDCLRRRLRIFVVIVVQKQAERRCRRKYQQSRQQTAKEPAHRCFLHHIRPKTAASTAAPAAANGSFCSGSAGTSASSVVSVRPSGRLIFSPFSRSSTCALPSADRVSVTARVSASVSSSARGVSTGSEKAIPFLFSVNGSSSSISASRRVPESTAPSAVSCSRTGAADSAATGCLTSPDGAPAGCRCTGCRLSV